MISAAGFADGSIDSRPSDDTDGVTSVSSDARSKNCRRADCRTLAYSAPTASAGGTDIKAQSPGPNAQSRSDHNSAVQRNTLIDFFHDLAGIQGEFLVYDDGGRKSTR